MKTIIYLMLSGLTTASLTFGNWTLVENFEDPDPLAGWEFRDTDNQTDIQDPNDENAPVVQVNEAINTGSNVYYRKSAAPPGITYNFQAVGYYPLPMPIPVFPSNDPQVVTLYLRVAIESPSLDVNFGLTNLPLEVPPPGEGEVPDPSVVGFAQPYDAFEAQARIQGRATGGALEARDLGEFARLQFTAENGFEPADNVPAFTPLTWYELWIVVDNTVITPADGQDMFVYIRGGSEFPTITPVYSFIDPDDSGIPDALFRNGRELPLIALLIISNTGGGTVPIHGNAGALFDDIYIDYTGQNLTRPAGVTVSDQFIIEEFAEGISRTGDILSMTFGTEAGEDIELLKSSTLDRTSFVPVPGSRTTASGESVTFDQQIDEERAFFKARKFIGGAQ